MFLRAFATLTALILCVNFTGRASAQSTITVTTGQPPLSLNGSTTPVNASVSLPAGLAPGDGVSIVITVKNTTTGVSSVNRKSTTVGAFTGPNGALFNCSVPAGSTGNGFVITYSFTYNDAVMGSGGATGTKTGSY